MFAPLPAMVDHREQLNALALALLSRAAEYERKRDSRCVFTLAYALLTRRLAVACGTEALDWDWIARLATAFSARYFLALDAIDHGTSPPPAWAHVFGTLGTSRTSVLEDLLFPMTAHIVRDLPYALVDVGLEHDARNHLREFHHINDLMDDTIEEIQGMVPERYGPHTGWLDRVAGGLDEILTNYGVRVSRAAAWYNANRLLDAASSDEARRSIERSPRIVVEIVMAPPVRSLDFVLSWMRRLASLVRRWPQTPPRFPAVASDDDRSPV
jgi:uncharacterized protein DUF5995